MVGAKKKPVRRSKALAAGQYKTAKHPRTGKWHVVGKAGRFWMQVSEGFSTAKQAEARMKRQYAADRAAIRELSV